MTQVLSPFATLSTSPDRRKRIRRVCSPYTRKNRPNAPLKSLDDCLRDIDSRTPERADAHTKLHELLKTEKLSAELIAIALHDGCARHSIPMSLGMSASFALADRDYTRLLLDRLRDVNMIDLKPPCVAKASSITVRLCGPNMPLTYTLSACIVANSLDTHPEFQEFDKEVLAAASMVAASAAWCLGQRRGLNSITVPSLESAIRAARARPRDVEIVYSRMRSILTQLLISPMTARVIDNMQKSGEDFKAIVTKYWDIQRNSYIPKPLSKGKTPSSIISTLVALTPRTISSMEILKRNNMVDVAEAAILLYWYTSGSHSCNPRFPSFDISYFDWEPLQLIK